MAKSSRSSSKKANKSKLRSRVFRPVEERRTVRLNSALLRLASQPKPTEMGTMKMDVEHQNYEQHEAGEAHKAKQTEGMEIDGVSTPMLSTSKSTQSKVRRKSLRAVQKHKRRRKLSASMVFPSYRKGKLVGQSRKQRK